MAEMLTTPQAPFPSARERPGRPGLRREIGFIGLLWASGGSIIGSGWLFGAQGALSVAGPAAIVSWGIGAIAILLLALVHTELGAMYPVAGGTARFPHYTFGGAVGASFGWFSWLQAATVAPIEVMAVIQYSQHYSFAHDWMHVSNGQNVLTATGIVVAVLLMAALTAINFLGVRKLANTNSAATWWKVGVPVLTIVALAFAGLHFGNFHAADGFAPGGAAGVLAAVSTGGIVFALLGFEQADQLAGESHNPRRDIPRAVIGAIVIGAVIYILLQLVFLLALPASQIGGHWADSPFTTFSGPFAELSALVGLGWLATILYIDAIVSPGGTGLIYTTGASRVSYGLSRNGYIPSAYETTDRRGVPWVGLLTAFVVGCVCFLPFPSWRSLVGLITSASVLMYAGAPLALGVAILLGYVILTLNHVLRLNPVRPEFEIRSAVWLPVYLVGLGLIVFLSDFGPLEHPLFPLWWDMVAVIIFSVGIYYWALRVALPEHKIRALIDGAPAS